MHAARNIAIIGWGVLILLIGIAGVIRFSPILTVRSVVCQVNDDPCPDYLQAELEKLRGLFIFDAALDDAITVVLRRPLGLKDGTLQRQLPDTLIFRFTAAAPAYILISPDRSIRVVISEQGTEVLTPRDDLPKITTPMEFITTIQEQHSLPQDFHQQISALLTTTTGLPIQPTEWRYAPPTIQVLFGNDFQAIIPLTESARATAQLQILLRNWPLPQVKDPIRTIDLRFKYPVLKTSFF